MNSVVVVCVCACIDCSVMQYDADCGIVDCLRSPQQARGLWLGCRQTDVVCVCVCLCVECPSLVEGTD